MPETRPAPRPSLDPDAVRVISFIACGLLISVKADGRFPLPDSLSEVAFQLLLLPYTVALVAAVAAFLGADRVARVVERALPRGLVEIRPVVWAVAGLVLFELLTLIVLRGEALKYAAFGYDLDSPVLLYLALLTGLALIAACWRGRIHGTRLFMAAGVTYLASQVASLIWFPLHAGRSDMLPLIAKAVQRFLEGVNPYGAYAIPHTVPLTYLPGTWLPFVPAIALGLDPRVVHFLATLSAVALLIVAAPPARRSITGSLGALFLLTPYLQYRHEIYLGTLWLSLALTTVLEARGSHFLGVALGWAVSTSQFVWVILPVYVAQFYRRTGRRESARLVAIALGTSVLLIVPFLLLGPQEFVRGVFGHWQRTLDVTTANLAYFVARLGSLEALRWAQAAAWLVALFVALKRMGPKDSPWAAMTATLCVFVLFNSVVWVYFYLTVFFFMLAAVSRNGREE